MPYIGNASANRFVASKAATQFSGDGSTTAFTLEHSVGADEDILVSVDGVIQEPSVAYAVSNGTTLTFTAAPSSNSGNNIFVYYLFRTVGTVSHPSNNAFTATNGTLTGTLDVTGASTLNGNVTLGGTTPTLTIGDAGAEDAKIVFDGNAQDYHIGLDDSADSLTIGLGSTLGTTTHMKFDSTGAITKPLQPAFSAGITSTISNIAIDSLQTTTLDNEIYDVNGDFSSNTFTAPVTGKYQLSAVFYFNQIDASAGYYILRITTSNRSYDRVMNMAGRADENYSSYTISVLADMDVNDTATIGTLQSGGAAQTDMTGGTYFTGVLVC